MSTTTDETQPQSYPEHAKLTEIAEQSQTIGEFLENSRFQLAEYREVDGYREPQLLPVNTSVQKVLAEHFGIDLDAIEREKRDMLARLARSDT